MDSREELRWYALYVKARSEKWVADRALSMGMEAYVPIQELMRMYAKSKRITKKPLISGIVFMHINSSHFSKLLSIPYTGQFIKYQNSPAIIPDHEIELLKRITGEIIASHELNTEFNLGEDIEILSGSLAGVKAKFVKIKGKNRILIRMESIGYGLEVEVEMSLVRKTK